MRFRMGLAIGFATGYVLGTKAGRERYEQIREATSGLWGSAAGRQVRDAANKVAEQASQVVGAVREPAEDPIYTGREAGNGSI